MCKLHFDSGTGNFFSFYCQPQTFATPHLDRILYFLCFGQTFSFHINKICACHVLCAIHSIQSEVFYYINFIFQSVNVALFLVNPCISQEHLFFNHTFHFLVIFLGLGLIRPGRVLYNLRKLNELPYHLIQSGRKQDLKKVLCHNSQNFSLCFH